MSDDLVKNLCNDDLESLMKEAEQAAGDAETTAQTIRDFGGKAVAFFGDVSDFETGACTSSGDGGRHVRQDRHPRQRSRDVRVQPHLGDE